MSAAAYLPDDALPIRKGDILQTQLVRYRVTYANGSQVFGRLVGVWDGKVWREPVGVAPFHDEQLQMRDASYKERASDGGLVFRSLPAPKWKRVTVAEVA